jgi:ssRNA-specific RNase YbeY (16S rRNA maturation enzyme)
MVHGALHLCGYDDKEGKAHQMRDMEEKYIAKFHGQCFTWNIKG